MGPEVINIFISECDPRAPSQNNIPRAKSKPKCAARAGRVKKISSSSAAAAAA
jgi:hypothetical protein